MDSLSGWVDVCSISPRKSLVTQQLVGTISVISLTLLIFNVAEEMLFLRLGEEVLKVSAFSFLSLFMVFIKVFSFYPLSEDQFSQSLVIYSINPFPVCACIELGDS